jgi:hypothetical protein
MMKYIGLTDAEITVLEEALNEVQTIYEEVADQPGREAEGEAGIRIITSILNKLAGG